MDTPVKIELVEEAHDSLSTIDLPETDFGESPETLCDVVLNEQETPVAVETCSEVKEEFSKPPEQTVLTVTIVSKFSSS
jgi:hypothetical protein